MNNEIVYDNDEIVDNGGTTNDIMRGARTVKKNRGYPLDYKIGQSNQSNSNDITNSAMFRELFGNDGVAQFKNLERKSNANKINIIDMGTTNPNKGGQKESENTSGSH